MIVGIDEVGRGPWAGPLVVGAVVLGDTKINGLTDSKKLSRKKRETLAVEIQTKAAAYGIGWVDTNELDELGISAALTLGCRRALEQIMVPYHEIIIDGTVNLLAGTGKGPYVTTMKKADLLIESVSAAAILAKVARDDFMEEQDDIYPGYHFASHVGYGTAAHRTAIERLGLTSLHRRSFAPIARFEQSGATAVKPVTTKQIGDKAEAAAADWLGAQGYHVIDRNWKTRFCEIDIVATKADTLYFVEVKHRKQDRQGGGIAAITATKLRRMRFAVLVYQKFNNLLSADAELMVVTTHGEPPVVELSLVVE